MTILEESAHYKHPATWNEKMLSKAWWQSPTRGNSASSRAFNVPLAENSTKRDMHIPALVTIAP